MPAGLYGGLGLHCECCPTLDLQLTRFMDSKERSSSNARESLNGAQCVQPSISRRRACLTILETAVFGTAPIRRHGYAALQRTPRLQGARLSARRPQALGAAGRKSARVSPRARSPCSGDDGRCRLRRRGVRQNLRPRSLEATALPHRAQCPAPRPSAPAQVASCHWRPCSWMGLREWGGEQPSRGGGQPIQPAPAARGDRACGPLRAAFPPLRPGSQRRKGVSDRGGASGLRGPGRRKAPCALWPALPCASRPDGCLQLGRQRRDAVLASARERGVPGGRAAARVSPHASAEFSRS